MTVELGKAVEGFLGGYFSTCRRSDKTQTAYRVDLAQLRLYCGSDKPLRSIDAECLEAWAHQMRSGGYAAVSVRRKFATVRVFFAYWVRKGSLDASPLWRIRLDLGRQRLLPRCLTASDAKGLIEQAWRGVHITPAVLDSPRDPRFLAIRNVTALEILFATGMRVGELVNLGVRDWCRDDSAFVVMGKGMRQRLAGVVPWGETRS
jgi:site-specific recombinase XerD